MSQGSCRATKARPKANYQHEIFTILWESIQTIHASNQEKLKPTEWPNGWYTTSTQA